MTMETFAAGKSQTLLLAVILSLLFFWAIPFSRAEATGYMSSNGSGSYRNNSYPNNYSGNYSYNNSNGYWNTSYPYSYNYSYNTYPNNYSYNNYPYNNYSYNAYPYNSYYGNYYGNSYGYNYQYPAPTCTITLSAGNNYWNNWNNGYYGNSYNYSAQLTWWSSNANSATINPGVGSVALSGSQTVYPSSNQVYVLTVQGQGGVRTCSTSAYLPTPSYSIAPTTYAYQTYPTYTAPAVYASAISVSNSYPSVSLSKIPYTGVSYGPLGDALVWLAIVIVAALAASTLLVLRRRQFATILSSVVSRRA